VLLGLALMALLLAGCAADKATQCPTPAGELLLPPAPLGKLDNAAPMSQPDQVTAWLNDTERERIKDDKGPSRKTAVQIDARPQLRRDPSRPCRLHRAADRGHGHSLFSGYSGSCEAVGFCS
jgi:hypothetical protein